MSLFAYIYDCQPPALRGSHPPLSLLLTPVGAGTLLEYLHASIGPAPLHALSVVTVSEMPADYEPALRSVGVPLHTLLSVAELPGVVDNLEPSDWLLFVDARNFPIEGLDISPLLRELTDWRLAKHLVALEAAADGTREYVQLDAAGNVRRVQRYYDGFTRLRSSGVTCSLVSAASARVVSQRGFQSLASLRCELAAQGVPSRDYAFSGGTFDLTDEHALLGLIERFVCTAVDQPPPAGYRVLDGGGLAAESARIDPSARLLGAVVLQEGVELEAGATIIGPALLGAGARVRRGAVLAQCAVMPGRTVASGVTLRQALVARDDAGRRNGTSPRNGSSYHVHAPRRAASRSRGKRAQRRQRIYPIIKRGLDAVTALLGLITLAPLLALVGLAVRLTSAGPMFFGHEREGLGGRVFRCYKFRTMVHGAHALQRLLYAANQVDGPQFKLRSDPRVTWVGRLLRASNIDELPQLYNVLIGEMSLIGPRPSPFRENQICVPWRQARLSIRPGITGLWQICRHERSAGDFHQWIFYDMLYVRHLSLALDLKILLATLLTFGGRWSVPLEWMISDRKLAGDNEEVPSFTAAPELYQPSADVAPQRRELPLESA